MTFIYLGRQDGLKTFQTCAGQGNNGKIFCIILAYVIGKILSWSDQRQLNSSLWSDKEQPVYSFGV